MTIRILIILGIIGFVISACELPKEPDNLSDGPAVTVERSIDLPPELDRVLRDYERHWRASNADSLAALFTEEGYILRPGHRATRGREAIAKAYQNAGGTLYLHHLMYEMQNSLAYIIGVYGYEPGQFQEGKFILTLRKEADERWYITADMDNGND